jgi:hypothetical protein
MQSPDTAKAAHRGNGGDLLNKQLAQLDYSNTKLQPQKQGRTFQIILTLWSLAALVTAWSPK